MKSRRFNRSNGIRSPAKSRDRGAGYQIGMDQSAAYAIRLRPPRAAFNIVAFAVLPRLLSSPAAGRERWIHEIKHDGVRLLARRGAAGVRLLRQQDFACVASNLAGRRTRRTFIHERIENETTWCL